MKDGVNAGPNGQVPVRTPFFGPETHLEPNPNTQQGVFPPPDFGPHMSALSRPALAALGSHQQPARSLHEFDRTVEQQSARQPHKLKVAGASPAGATPSRPVRSQPTPLASSLASVVPGTETVPGMLGRTALSDRRRISAASILADAQEIEAAHELGISGKCWAFALPLSMGLWVAIIEAVRWGLVA